MCVICETDMLRIGNLGLKMGVSHAVHIQYAHVHIWKYQLPPPPGGGGGGSTRQMSSPMHVTRFVGPSIVIYGKSHFIAS